MQTSLAKSATNSLNEEFGTNIFIDKIRLSPFNLNTHIKDLYVEDYRGDTLIYIQKVSTSILNLRNMMNNKMQFGDFELTGLLMNLKTYEGETDTNLDVFVEKVDDGQPRQPGTPPFLMTSDEIKIDEAIFRLIDENYDYSTVLDFSELEILAKDFEVLGPEVRMQIVELSFEDSRGLKLEQLKTDFTYTKSQMRFEELDIQTKQSSLKGNLQFDYNREDFSRFLDAVNVSGGFTDAKIAFNDLNVFYNEFGEDKIAEFTTSFSGVLNDFTASDLVLSSDNTGVRGDFTFKNLFRNTEPLIINSTIDNITTNYYQLRSILPNILSANIPPTIERLGRFTIRGQAEITESSIDTQISASTALGNGFADLQMTNINQVDNASYRGLISLSEFDFGTFVNDPQFGRTSLDMNVEGRGFLAEYLNTKADGEVSKLEFRGYEYERINVAGVFKDQLFDGNLICNDPNFRFDFRGLADFSKELNDFNFVADVDYADLKRMNFINDTVSIFRGNVKMDITGNSLDNIAGEINFTDTAYQNKNEIYYFDDFKVTSLFENDSIREIRINSPDIVQGYAKGNFKVSELGRLVQNSVGSIYTNYNPYEISNGQHVNFNFKIYNKIIDVFYPEVSFGPDTFIRGRIVSDEQDFKLTFESPEIEAFNNTLNGIELQIDNKNPLFNTFLSVEKMNTVYYNVEEFNLINTTIKDTLFFRTEFKGTGDYQDEYNLNFYHTFDGDNNSVIGLKRSDINLKGNKWLLNKESNLKNKIILNSSLDSITIQEIVMDNLNNERIRLNGELADSTYKDLELEFKLVSLEKITPAIDSLKLDGKVDGFLNILQKDGKYLPSSSLQIDDFSVNETVLGDLEMMVFGNDDLSEYGVNTWLTYRGQESFGMTGKIFDSPTKTTLDLLTTFEDFSLEPFAPLGEDVISNIRGIINGSARITGNTRNPNINGTLTMNNAGLGIPYLNVDYDFASMSRVRMFDQTFFFEKIILTDIDEQTSAILDGTISHTEFDNWTLDLKVDAEDRFLVLNTTYEEEALYYGSGFVKGSGAIHGDVNTLKIDFEGSTARGTSLKIPLSDLTAVGDYSFINFIERSRQTQVDLTSEVEEYNGVELFFDLNVTPEAEVEVVIDQQTGSSLKGTGEGLLLFEINTEDTFNMYGEFAVVEGVFNYKYGGLIDKTFGVTPGGRIVWEGDPYEAILDLEAIYELTANPAPLLENASSRINRIDTEVIIRLKDELQNPTIEFDVDFPGSSSVLKSELEYRLQDPTIKNNNAFFLLAQGTFVGEGEGLGQQAVTGNLLQTASGLINSVLSGDGETFNFGLSYEQGYLDSEDRVGVTLSTQLSDRILINGRVGVPVGAGGVSEAAVAGDVEVQVLLNEKGTLSAKIFNRENNELQQFLTERQGYTQGVGLSYQVDFDSFQDLLQQIFRKKETEKEDEKIDDRAEVIGQDSLIRFRTKSKPRNK